MEVYLETMMARLNCGEWEILQDHFVYSQHWSDEKWNSSMARGGGNKKRFQYCTDPPGQEILYLRALQGHSGRNLIDPSLQDNVLIPNNFFEYTYHIGCATNLHSIENSGLIPGGQNLSKRQTAFFASVDPMNKEHRDPNKIDLNAPRLAWYKQKTWREHQNTENWVDIKLALRKGFKFYQTRSNAIILYNTLAAYCIPKAIMMESGEIIYEKVYASPRLPPKISLKHDWMKELGSEVARQPEGEVARQAKGSRPTQPNPNPNHDRTGRPVVCSENTSRSQEIDTRFSRDSKNTNLNVDANHDRTERPVVCRQPVGSSSTFNEVDIDFRISGLPQNVVKQAENSRVRELVKKIESHPHREALQADLQQNNVYQFSDDSKEMIRELDNVELFELCETISKV